MLWNPNYVADLNSSVPVAARAVAFGAFRFATPSAFYATRGAGNAAVFWTRYRGRIAVAINTQAYCRGSRAAMSANPQRRTGPNKNKTDRMSGIVFGSQKKVTDYAPN